MMAYEVVDGHFNEWVVFVHGIGGSTRTWKKQIDDFSRQYNLLLLDLPGHGLNSENTIDTVDPQKLHNGIKETLDHLHIEKAHFVGLSMGTIVIVNFAINYPEYIQTIVLGGSTLKLSGAHKLPVILANKMKHCIPYGFLYQFFAWFLMPKENHKKSRLIFLREVIKLKRETMYAWIEYLQFGLDSEKILARLDSLGKDILMISGDEDHCFIQDAKRVAKRLHNTKLIVIEKCGHVCSIEKWNIFNNIVLEYLSFS